MNNITFVPATPEDSDYFYTTRRNGMFPHMAKIGREWDEESERRYNTERFNMQLPFLRMIHVDGARVGFICVRPDGTNNIYIESFCIEKRYQGRGELSKKIINIILQEPKVTGSKLLAEIMPGYASGRLVRRMGFQKIGHVGDLDLFERPAALPLLRFGLIPPSRS